MSKKDRIFAITFVLKDEDEESGLTWKTSTCSYSFPEEMEDREAAICVSSELIKIMEINMDDLIEVIPIVIPPSVINGHLSAISGCN